MRKARHSCQQSLIGFTAHEGADGDWEPFATPLSRLVLSAAWSVRP